MASSFEEQKQNTIGIKTILVGLGGVGLPIIHLFPVFSCKPCEPFRRVDSDGNSGCCYPASNFFLCCAPICTAWFYPLDNKDRNILAKDVGKKVDNQAVVVTATTNRLAF